MGAARFELTIEQHSTFVIDMYLKDGDGAYMDLTGHDVIAEVRQEPNDEIILVENFATIDDPTNGKIILFISETKTSALIRDNFTATWDLVLVGPLISGQKQYTRILEGKCFLSEGVSKK